MSVNKDELKAEVIKIIESPVESTVSTADIRIGFWSSTALEEKAIKLASLIEAKCLEAKLSDYTQLAWDAAKEDKHGFKTGEIGKRVIAELKRLDENFDIRWLYSLQERANGLTRLTKE